MRPELPAEAQQIWADYPFDEVAQNAIERMRRYIKAQNIVFTQDLLDSLSYQLINRSEELYTEIVINFSGYGRYKDMKRLSFEKMPPVAAIEEYVSRVGVEKFAYVPGYKQGSRALAEMSSSRKANRIAWGVAIGIRRKGVIKRRGEGWYNRSKGPAIMAMRKGITEIILDLVLKNTQSNLQAE